MTERHPNQDRTELVQTGQIYSLAFGILERFGKPFYKFDGKTLTAKSFFCDSKDYKLNSDILISMEVEEMNGAVKRTPISVSVIREYDSNRALVREFTLSEREIKTKVRKRTKDGKHPIFENIPPRVVNQFTPPPETIWAWLREARVNLEAGIIEPPRDDKPQSPTFIKVSKEIIELLKGKSPK